VGRQKKGTEEKLATRSFEERGLPSDKTVKKKSIICAVRLAIKLICGGAEKTAIISKDMCEKRKQNWQNNNTES